MNPKLEELFNLYKNLRVVNTIVNEILVLDRLVYNYVEGDSIDMIDYCITKYDKEIRQIGALYQNKVVVDNDPKIYETKDDVEINGDVAYIRDALIMIGAVKSGIRKDLVQVVYEVRGENL